MPALDHRNTAPEVVIREIFKVWISVYGCPDAFLSDNGGEFSNSKFREMCEKFNINVKTTAAESPWSNGICERHNKVLADNIMKIIAENKCGLDIAVCWAINAKNSLQNVHGYSPFQLVFGQNPRLPGILNDKPPALDDMTSTKIIRENLNALHKARQAFIASESSEKIRRALRHNVRTSGDIRYFTGDKVYYKRLSKNRWQGPAVVLGQDGQQVLVKHGGVYVRVHPCRLKLDKQYRQQNSVSSEKPFTCSKCENEKCVSEKCNSDQCNSDDLQMEDNVHGESFDGQNISDTSDDEGKVNDDIDSSGRNETAIMDPADNQDASLRNDREQQQQIDDVGETAIPRKSNDALKKGMYVKYRINEDEEDWYKARLLSRSGKATGKYRNEWNVEDDIEGKHVVDFGYVDEWEECSSTDLETQEEVQITEIYQTESLQEIFDAKNRELESWSKHQVYEEIDDTGQDCISVRWVVTPKIIDGQQKMKARLCARGFEESANFRTDSPTCSR